MGAEGLVAERETGLKPATLCLEGRKFALLYVCALGVCICVVSLCLRYAKTQLVILRCKYTTLYRFIA